MQKRLYVQASGTLPKHTAAVFCLHKKHSAQQNVRFRCTLISAVFGVPEAFFKSNLYSAYSSKNRINCIYSIIKKSGFAQFFLL